MLISRTAENAMSAEEEVEALNSWDPFPFRYLVLSPFSYKPTRINCNPSPPENAAWLPFVHFRTSEHPLGRVLTAAYNGCKTCPMPLRLHRSPLFALLLIPLLARSIQAQPAPQPRAKAQHLTVTLLVPPAQIAPGENFTAGLDFRMEEGWHVYWINAGASGEPPA